MSVTAQNILNFIDFKKATICTQKFILLDVKPNGIFMRTIDIR